MLLGGIAAFVQFWVIQSCEPRNIKGEGHEVPLLVSGQCCSDVMLSH